MAGDESAKHLNSYIRRILEIIRSKERACSFRELDELLGFRILSNIHLLNALKSNSKIEMSRDALRYVPEFNIKTVSDLYDAVKSVGYKEGIELARLCDSPVDVRPFIKQLEKENKIIIIKDMDNSEIVYFYDVNDDKIITASSGIKQLWHSVKIPNYRDVLEELSLAGVKNMNTTVIKKKIPIKIKQNKKVKRRIKITNTHVQNLDLTSLDDSE
ncbi:transcription initiation factor TFIIE subunit beta [Enteropsectra breve]|nr:transcription initiation factor TFIIE subunit beta [Enteropsectra breve]